MSGRVPPQPLDASAWLTIRLHANGALSVSGHVGDKTLALALLDHAREAITSQIKSDTIVLPNRDVDVAPSIPLRDVGSMAPHERGDP